MSQQSHRIAVVIPCYDVSRTIEGVVATIPPDVWRIYCVDDCSNDDSRSVISQLARRDPRVVAVARETNGGVGAAVVKGLRRALDDGADVVVKVDGDGQMNGAFVPDFAKPILEGEADYVKGNRFFDIEHVLEMPRLRLLGNAGLSFFSKLSTGYWHLFDPTNGYVAIHAEVARLIPLHKLHPRYFFESDFLFRLAILRAKVIELPMETTYGEEVSNLSIWRCLVTFPFLHFRNFMKRLFYNYVLRNFSIGSIGLPTGVLLMTLGAGYGLAKWIESFRTDEAATAGTVMLSALPVLVGIQLILGFLSQDISSVPDQPVHRRLLHKKVIVTPRRLQGKK
ncbi:glycosyltransferase family 2 protein [Sphingomicrobium astaxanthinifaciens]|uniref:glycosyltransferase family 2 protein n=1 Tax=Sphingomicrobium astaxanthinifaciens TaxID=1227949 RepID=UPI001FCCC047|nr:glycosyltransferase family 2 protein [Sphingomicrobium astaxanthinifaciens]MCJ7421411.1 glycosyltransferase family 2 protein [Sphingomicrobium astaxanthinifaciens]